jgi:ABC-type cobalt transport system substrate-binding protein
VKIRLFIIIIIIVVVVIIIIICSSNRTAFQGRSVTAQQSKASKVQFTSPVL